MRFTYPARLQRAGADEIVVSLPNLTKVATDSHSK